MTYTPNSNNIALVSDAVQTLSKIMGDRGVVLEDFIGGLTQGLNAVLDNGIAHTDPRYAEVLRTAASVNLTGNFGGDLGEFRGNGKRLH